MTLVRNHQLLSSGSNIRFISILLTALCCCCLNTYAGAQVFGKKKNTPLIDNDTLKVLPEQPKKISSLPIIKPTTKSVTNYKKPDHFNIALLLPFNVMQSMEVDTSGQTYYDFTPETSLAIQYYHGVMLALDSLRKTGLKLRVFTLDGGTDSNTLRRIFNSGIIDSMNLVIGPVYNSSLRVAALLAKQKHKILISPFSASEKIATQNSFYISANPTLSRHCYTMLSYLHDNYHSKKITLLYNANSSDTITVRLLKNAATNFNDLNLVSVTDTAYSKLKSQLSATDTNLIIVPSMDEDYVGIITRQLYSCSTTTPLVVFGMPTWDDFATVRLDYLTAIHCLITVSDWCDKNGMAWKKFEHDFVATYHSRPLQRNVTGYDQMMLTAKLLGTDSLNILHVSYHGLGENFNFIPYYNNPDHIGDPDFIENSNVHVMRFKDNSLVKQF